MIVIKWESIMLAVSKHSLAYIILSHLQRTYLCESIICMLIVVVSFRHCVGTVEGALYLKAEY